MVGGVESLSAISNFNRSVDGGIMDSSINFGVATALLSHWKMYYYILTNYTEKSARKFVYLN